MDLETITLRIDKNQRDFFLKLVSMLEFAEVLSPENLLQQYQQNAPIDVPLTEAEIMEEINAIRKSVPSNRKS